jgi:hypothetical protein
MEIDGPIPLAISSVNGLRRGALEQLTAAMQAQGRQPDGLELEPDPWRYCHRRLTSRSR